MCGIYAVFGRFSDGDAARWVNRANQIQGHRGPDKTSHSVIQLNNGQRALLGHQRLSILDLSDAGTQPMMSASGDSAIILNGEIYNYVELAARMSRQRRTGTDTEVVVELMEALGVAKTLTDANGMWALAYVHARSNVVALSRDRLGKKPLYVWQGTDRIVVASELKTVAALSDTRFAIDPQIVRDYVEQGLQDVGDASWLKGIVSLSAGSVAQIAWTGVDGAPVLSPGNRWTPGIGPSFANADDASAALKALVADSVRLRLRADVKVGITLSGGVDSSILAAEMAQQFADPALVHAISAVSPGSSGDESLHIDRICKGLGITTHKVDLSRNVSDMFGLMDRVTWHNDAPLGSFSNVAFYRLMEAARSQGVKVVLSGQGADEVFCGYRKYFFWSIRELIRSGKPLAALGSVMQSAAARTVVTQINYSEAKRYLPGGRTTSILTDELVGGTAARNVGLGAKPMSERQWDDLAKFSVPYLCHYEDRGSMAHGVEIRAPFLDYRIVEFGLSLPTAFKLRSGWTKHVLRRAFEADLPKAIAWRRDKKGFTNPQGEWLRKELRPEVESTFESQAKMYDLGLIDRGRLLDLNARFQKGDPTIAHRQIFAPWALEIWLKQFDEFIA